MTIDAVVFDMDGLMLDTEPMYKAAWQRASAELGYTLEDSWYVKLAGRPNEDCERTLQEWFGAAFPLDLFRARWPAMWRAEAAATGIATKPGLPELLAFLEQQRLPVAVATSSDADYAAFSLREAGLDGRFSVIVTCDQIARGKPAPDIYLEAARRLGVESAACVALEDSEAGILAASSAGMRAWLIPDMTEPSAAAVQAASHVLASLHEARELMATLMATKRLGVR